VFEGNLLSVKDFNGVTPPTQMDFDKTKFWVRMFNLPQACMGEEVGIRLGSLVGEVAQVETDEEGVGWGEHLRVKIQIDISKPLSRGRILKIQGDPVWIAFQYERLPKFCFHCGVIRHGPSGCLTKKASTRQEGPSTV